MGREHEPLVRVVRGDPTPEELAALVTVLAARGRPGAAGSQPSAGPPRWVSHARPGAVVGGLPRRGPEAWRSPALPR